jgi:predicted homoserine dehydrogenase-like protein
VKYALKAFENGRHLMMVNLEADVLVGPSERGKSNEEEKHHVQEFVGVGDLPDIFLMCHPDDSGRPTGDLKASHPLGNLR